MIRIHIDWNYTSPVLGIASGVVSIDDFKTDGATPGENILKFKVRVERGSIGFTGLDDKGVPSKLFKLFRAKVSLMAHSYHRGMILEDYDFEWYEDSEVEPNWRQTKTNYEKINS